MGIFDSIRNAFSGGKEDAADAAPSPGPAPEPGVAAPAETSGAATASYTVESGDSLWKIAENVYGDGSKYPLIFEANRNVLDAPDRILPGQVLSIPALED